MKNLTALLFCLISILSFGTAIAQGENNIWCFGQRTGLDFNGPSPVFFEHNMDVYESSASVSDAAGNLLFYTAGYNVWDRNGNLMPNGTGLLGNYNGSSAGGVAIVKSISNPDQYYLISTDAVELNLHKAYYSVVDMTLNGGLGDIVSSQKNILLATDVAEGIVIAPMNGCSGFWAIVHKKDNANYLAFKIDNAGISSTPVVSTGIIATSPDMYGNQGHMRMNNANNKLIRGGYQMEIASFNNVTGVLSGFALIVPALQNNTGITSIIFSPDDSKAYFTDIYSIYQMNIALMPNAIAVQNSITELDSGMYAGMRLGPDNKIYVMRFWTKYLARINTPNALGPACDLDPTYLTLPPYAVGAITNIATFVELGSPVAVGQPDSFVVSAMDTNICFQPSITLVGNPTYNSYSWSTGSNQPAETFTQAGTYWLYSAEECVAYIDTFYIHTADFTVDLGNDTSLCPGNTLTLDATLDSASYLWQDNSTAPSYTVPAAGIYYVTVTKDGCSITDSVTINSIEPIMYIPQADTTICAGTQMEIFAIATPASQFVWSNGSTSNSTLINGAGTYTVTATNICGTFTDEVTINTELCNCEAFVPNAFSPNGDGKNETLQVILDCEGVSDYVFAVYNRYGQRIFESKQLKQGWDGTHDKHQVDMGTYFYYLKYKNNLGEEIKRKGDVVLIR